MVLGLSTSSDNAFLLVQVSLVSTRPSNYLENKVCLFA